MSWTDPTDVTDSWIPADDAPTDTDLIQIWIDRAERYLKAKVPTLAARIADEETDLLEKTQDVVSAMVQRLFRNPDGTRQRQETTGPFTESMTFGGDQPGSLWLTDDELQLLAGVSPGRHTAYSIDLLPADYVYPSAADDPWANA